MSGDWTIIRLTAWYKYYINMGVWSDILTTGYNVNRILNNFEETMNISIILSNMYTMKRTKLHIFNYTFKSYTMMITCRSHMVSYGGSHMTGGIV